MSIDIRGGLLIRPDDHLKGLFIDKATNKPATGAQVRLLLEEMIANGQEMLPLNPDCDNFDPKQGCLGHGELT